MAENQTSEYKSQFTKENITELRNVINGAVNKHAEENIEGGKLDLFLILAALGQAAFEVVLRTLPSDEDDAKKSREQMKVLVEQFITQIDKSRVEFKTKPAAELLAAAHSLSVLSEFYSRRRDDVLKRVLQEKSEK